MKKGHRIADIEGFPDEVRERLQPFSITTAEEFLSSLEVAGDDLFDALDVDPAAMDDAVVAAHEAAGAHFTDALRDLADQPEHPTGALPPTSREFDRYAQEQEEQRGEGDDP